MLERVITVLFVCTDVDIYAGSSKSLMNMVNSLGNMIKPIVLFPKDGFVPSIFKQAGIETLCHSFYSVCEKSDDRVLDHFIRPKKTLLYRRLHDDLSCARYVKRVLEDRSVDIIHSNTSVATVGIAISFMFSAKHIWHIREFIDLDFNERPFMGKGVLRKIINTADYRICITEAVKEQWSFKKKNTNVIYDGVVSGDDLEQVGEGGRENYILFCSAVIRSCKGADVAIEAFCRSGVWQRGYALKMVGHCPDDERLRLESLAAEYGVPMSLIHFEGYQDDVSVYFSKASAFLMCSQFEALGRVTIEAMYYGCPVIAKATGGTVEFLKDKVNGYLYSSVEECSRTIKDVVLSYQKAVVREARKTVIDNFTEKVFGRKVLRVYEQVMMQ